MNLNKRTVVWWISVCAFLSFCPNVNSHRLHDTPGETWPSRVEIMVGGSVDIFCHMNLSAFQDQCTVDDLYFMDISTQNPVPETDVQIVNKTTIKYTLSNASEQQTIIRCKCHNDAIADTKVYVGYSPNQRLVTDFRCSSFDFVRMQCNFTRPDNPVMTKYNVSFYFDAQNYKIEPICDLRKLPLTVCDLVDGKYRPLGEIYHFELYGKNPLGSFTQRFDVNDTQIMVLAKPGQDFKSNTTTNSVVFSFRMPKYDSSYRFKDLEWELFLKPLNMTEYEVKNVRPSVRGRNEFTWRITDLMAYYEYQLRLRVRLHGTESWSEPFTHKFRTAPCRPERPPRIDVGGFYTDPSETTVHLYWELLQPYEFNGYNFSYVIESQNGEQYTTDSNSAAFSWHKGIQHVYKLRSRNHLGLSDTFSSITIPVMWPASKSKSHTTPIVHNIYHETNGTFTLTWQAPEATLDLEDYTVFWCRSKRGLLNRCEGSIHYQHISRDTHKFTTAPQEHTLNLAVSANYKDFNTGMHWTECTMNEESDLVIMEPEVEATSATTIKIQWTSKICPSIIDGYNLSYCEVVEPETKIIKTDNDDANYVNCTDNSKIYYKLIPKTQNRFELTNLKPYTKYKVQIFMFSMRKVGKTSKPEYKRTFETAPSHPRQLNVSRISNTSVSITWLPPREPNGIVRTYTVVLNNERRDIPADLSDSYGRISHTLNNLSSSTSYKVYVLAQTKSNSYSQPSNDIHFTTLVGYPKKPENVGEEGSNNEAKVKWDKSTERTDYYEVAITLMRNDEIVKRRISVITDANNCVFKVPDCVDSNYFTTVSVRAVNAALLTHEVDENEVDKYVDDSADDKQYYDGSEELICVSRVGTTEQQSRSIKERQHDLLKRYNDKSIYRLYKSGWQFGPTYKCPSRDFAIFFVYSASAILMSVGFFMVLYMMRRKYNKMANIHCTLPAGLDAYVSKDFSGVNGSAFPHDFLAVIKSEISSSTRTAENNETAIAQRANDCHNEEHHLLETASQDSYSLNDHSHKQQQSSIAETVDIKSSNEIGIASNPMFESNFDLSFTPQEVQYRMTENAQSTSAANNYIQATNFSVTPAMQQFTTPMTNGYIKPNALANWQSIVTQPMPPTSPSGYVTVESIDANSQIGHKPSLPSAIPEFTVPNNNGYIQANILERTKPNFPSTQIAVNNAATMNETVLQAPLTHSTDSYTTLEQLGKMSAAFPATNDWNRHSIHSLTQDLGIPIVAPSNVPPGISGYVTPRELTAFGQQHQQQQQHNLN